LRFLLDTHCWLWMQVSPERIPEQAREQLTDPESSLFLSAASSWEIAIKWALGRLPLPQPPEKYIPSCLERQGVLGLPIQHRHTLYMANLPSHHRDPFDRLLLAQAQVEKLTLVTADEKLVAYDGIDLLQLR